ncbi:hypothetical protein NC797_15265 [Aquibacillus sp. 3ASR75-11]|uniref:Uncharacterized protein n=1 Tax=Terrihalobacillus insolitus TaxID=2950438 RepID=A0A9X3WU67_9BACI|nr:hypothetical protein [Terrihalobacillus insolitus]MDC3414998.1 hypothetical protein [Terrihalobacillus insolitus]MDC3425867.1 hypothetical protein [Terrihalobacillus insolitus]
MKSQYVFILSILLIMSFFVTKKKCNVLENIFLFCVLEFVFTSYFAILYINHNFWEITKSIEWFIAFRIYEVIIVPLLYMFYYNLIPKLQTKLSKVVYTLLFVGILYGNEYILVKWGVIVYSNWNAWQSILFLSIILTSVYFLLLGFRHILKIEGVSQR